MCTLAIYFQCDAHYPLIIAANRDEFYTRPSLPPASLSRQPWVVGGKDMTAGGTWLGVNGCHMVAGLLNRRTAAPPDPTRRSRGLLCLDVLRQRSPQEVLRRLHDCDLQAFNPFNLLVASPAAAFVLSNVSGAFDLTRLDPGLHLLTNLAVNDTTCPRIAKSYTLFEAARRVLEAEGLDAFRHELRAVLADHATPLDPRDDGSPNNLCMHGEAFGTRSSSLVVYCARGGGRFRFWHADGPPCRTPYVEIALPAPEAELAA